MSNLDNLPLGISRSVEGKTAAGSGSELSKSIAEISSVKAAKFIGFARKVSFVRDQTPPTASVFVNQKWSQTRQNSNFSYYKFGFIFSSRYEPW